MLRGKKQQQQEAPRVDVLLRQDAPLDESEQQAVIAELEAQQLAQARGFRRIFGVGALAGALFFAYAAASQRFHPWEARYTGELRPVTSSEGTQAALALQAAALAAAAYGLLSALPARSGATNPAPLDRGCLPPAASSRLALYAAVAATAGAAAYWLTALRASALKYGPAIGAHYELLWLPLLPLAYTVGCAYTSASITATGREVLAMRKMTYDYKAV